MFIQQNLLVLVIFVQVNLFVGTMFAQVNLFVEVMFVKVNPLMLISFHVNLFLLTIRVMLIHQQPLFFIFFLSILMFSVYCKFSIITMNIFTNLLLEIVILLSKLTRLREFFIMFISQSNRFLSFSLNTYITFQSCWTMLLLKMSEISFFYQ